MRLYSTCWLQVMRGVRWIGAEQVCSALCEGMNRCIDYFGWALGSVLWIGSRGLGMLRGWDGCWKNKGCVVNLSIAWWKTNDERRRDRHHQIAYSWVIALLLSQRDFRGNFFNFVSNQIQTEKSFSSEDWRINKTISRCWQRFTSRLYIRSWIYIFYRLSGSGLVSRLLWVLHGFQRRSNGHSFHFKSLTLLTKLTNVDWNN